MTVTHSDCVGGERCIICLGIRVRGFRPVAWADDGMICSNQCWRAFMFGARLLARIKNFAPWVITKVR